MLSANSVKYDPGPILSILSTTEPSKLNNLLDVLIFYPYLGFSGTISYSPGPGLPSPDSFRIYRCALENVPAYELLLPPLNSSYIITKYAPGPGNSFTSPTYYTFFLLYPPILPLYGPKQAE